jgi:Flp pilus assembly protein TadB
MAERDAPVPPTGEEIHLPGPTAIPIVMGAAITMAVIGLTIFWGLTVFGALLFVVLLVRWVRDTRRDIDELPLEHHE